MEQLERTRKSVIENVNTLIDTYESLIDSNDVDSLIKLQDELSIYSYRLAEEASENKFNYNKSYYIRKITHQRQIQSSMNIDKSIKMNKAIHMADMGVQDLVEKELQMEAISYKVDLLLKQLNKILDSLRQKISYLKIELERTRISN